MPVILLLLGAGLAYIGYARATAPRFKHGEILRVPGKPWASREDAIAYARELDLAPDEHRVVGAHAGTRSETWVIEITRGRA